MISVRKLHSSNANGQLVEWDKYVKTHPSGTFFHLSGWQIIFEEVFGHQTFFLYAIDKNNRICGILPLVLLKNIFGKKFFVSMPFVSLSGLLADSIEVEEILIKRTCQLGEKYNVQYVELRQLNELSTVKIKKDNYVNPILELQKDHEKIWMESLNAKVRNQVRQSFRRGVRVDFGLQYLDDFYEIFAKTMHRLGTPVHPKTLFLKLIEIFKEHVNLIVAQIGNQVTSGMILLNFDNKILSNPWAASLAEYQNYRPNNGMYWEAIKFGCQHGFKYFDFGRSTINAGTYNFKRQWGPEQHPLFYQYLLLKSTEIPQTDAVENKYEKVIELWKLLPYGFTKTYGSRLVKYLPEL